MPHKKVIVIGANSKATELQSQAAFKIGTKLADNDYVCIHGGGTGTMLATTLGMKSKNKEYGDSLTRIIWPTSMKLESEETRINYTKVQKTIVDTIHDRVGLLIKESETCDYIICYAGGAGTANELLAILTAYYDRTDKMPIILICDEDASLFLTPFNLLLSYWNIPTRPYMAELISKIRILTTEEIMNIL